MRSSAWSYPSLLTRRRWVVCITLTLGIGLLQTYPEFREGELLSSILLRFLLWVVETPLQVLLLSAAFDWCTERRLTTTWFWGVSLFVAVVSGVLFALAFVSLTQGLLDLELDEKGPLSYPLAGGFGGVMGVVIAGIWGVAFVSPHITEQAQRRALEREELRHEAEELRVSSELARLRSQLEPHFLLNTLNTIAGLVTQDPREARRLLGCLGDLLRDSLQGQDEMQTLDREIAWLKRYAAILESRHGDALRFDWDIAADVRDLLLPQLLLQPLVENAVQHGALCRASGGRVTVRAVLRGVGAEAKLVCTVTDNGPGLPKEEPRAAALGLRAVRRRLELRCVGSDFRLQTSSEGTSAIVELPLPVAEAR